MGHQPLHVASPAARLLAEGHEVRILDLGVQAWNQNDFDWAEVVAFSVPMHTAMRLGVEAAKEVRNRQPNTPIAFYGLYAAVSSDRTVGRLADTVIAGEYESELSAWVGKPATSDSPVRIDLGRKTFLPPARHLLPALNNYAHLQTEDGHRLVGYVEGSHGCRHRCRHCPIPSVYDGRYRIVGEETVLADIDQLVEAGAQHITFGDPDFLNAPPYSSALLAAAHSRHPQLTFDLTVKVEHILAHHQLWNEWRGLGVIFVVSAFETTNDEILQLLDKGHTAADEAAAVDVVRRAGIEIRPSWLPFTPWTTTGDLRSIFSFLDTNDLFESVDPVQMSIRLLVPEGSLVMDIEGIGSYMTDYDPEALTYGWESPDPAVDQVQREISNLAEEGAVGGESPVATLEKMWSLCVPGTLRIPAATTGKMRPRLTEPWFC